MVVCFGLGFVFLGGRDGPGDPAHMEVVFSGCGLGLVGDADGDVVEPDFAGAGHGEGDGQGTFAG